MRVMGVEPGLTRCGLSVIETGRGRQIIAFDVDVVRTPADESLSKRLLPISPATTPVGRVSGRRIGHRPTI